MCHSNNDELGIRKQIRLAGIQGLQVNITNLDKCIEFYCVQKQLVYCITRRSLIGGVFEWFTGCRKKDAFG